MLLCTKFLHLYFSLAHTQIFKSENWSKWSCSVPCSIISMDKKSNFVTKLHRKWMSIIFDQLKLLNFESSRQMTVTSHHNKHMTIVDMYLQVRYSLLISQIKNQHSKQKSLRFLFFSCSHFSSSSYHQTCLQITSSIESDISERVKREHCKAIASDQESGLQFAKGKKVHHSSLIEIF